MNPTSIQISATQLFICGGIKKQNIPDPKRRAEPSPFAAIFDVERG